MEKSWSAKIFCAYVLGLARYKSCKDGRLQPVVLLAALKVHDSLVLL